MHISHQFVSLALVVLLATADSRTPTTLISSDLRVLPSSDADSGLILGVDQGERRVRRPVTGAPFLNAPFIIKVDSVNGGSRDLVMGYEVLPPGGVISMHRHPHADEILFIQYGRGIAELGGRSAPVGPGGTVYIPHDVRVSLQAGPDSLGLVFIFSHPGFEHYLRDISVPEGEPLTPLSAAERKAIRERNEDHVVYDQP